jgi:hypothetical protein
VASPTVLALLAGAGFAAGMIDAIAGGGGLVTVPALLAAGLPPQLAIPTNKGQAVFGALASFAQFWRKRGIDRPRAPLAFACGFVGSLLGALLLLAVPPGPLKPVVIILLVAAAALVLSRRNVEPEPREPRMPRLALAAIALGLGAYDGFFGPGVGSMLIVAFTVVFGDTLVRASGNAKVVNLASNVAAFLLFTFRGAIDWPIALSMAGANMIGAFIGARMALQNGDRFVRWVVLAVVTCVVVKLTVDVLRSL